MAGKTAPDKQVWDEEIRLARLAADLGLRLPVVGRTPFRRLFVRARQYPIDDLHGGHCPHIDVGTAAVILPWHDPLRVAEHAAVLDILSSGRLRFGMGRGLARREFEAFRLSMGESRGRFDEAAPHDHRCAEDPASSKADGQFYKQPRIGDPASSATRLGRPHLRRRLERGFDRSAARLGAHMVMFADRPWDMRMPMIDKGRELHRDSMAPKPPCDADGICRLSTDLATCEDEARRYQGKFVESNFYHYEFLGDISRRSKATTATSRRPRSRGRPGSTARSKASCRRRAGGRRTRSCGGWKNGAPAGPFRAQRRLPFRRDAARGVRTGLSCSPRRCCRW